MTYEHFNTWRMGAASARPDLSVVIPAYNESLRIVPTIAAISTHLAGTGRDFEIIVSDDGSRDDTVSVVRNLGLRNLRVLAPGVNRGKGAAIRAGVDAAAGRHVLFTDADLSTPIEHVDEMLAVAEAGTPVVIGSRAAEGASESDRSGIRQLLSNVLRLLVRVVLGLRVSDTQCGFKLFERDAARALFAPQRFPGFSFDLEVLWLAKRNGLAIAEVPVDWYDAPGSTVAPLRTTLAFLRDLALIRLRHRRTPLLAPAGRRLAVVTAMPPSKTTLNEYGYHLTRHLAAHPGVEDVVALTEHGPAAPPAGVRVAPCWRFDSLRNPVSILREARRQRPDVVLFNLHFTSFGGRRVPAAVGLFTPALLRLAGFRTVVVLHNLVDTVDLESAGFGTNRLVNAVMRAIGALLTRVILRAHKIGTTMPTYVDILEQRYGAANVYLAPHGVFDEEPLVDSAPADGIRRVMTFGKFGTYKRVDGLIDAHRRLVARPEFADVELVIAGSDSPNAQGYLDEMQAASADLPSVRFTGYVEEEDVPGLFRSASVVAFPYTSTTGSSGPLHQAGTYGRAVVVPEVGDFLDLIHEEGFAGIPFDPESPDSLAEALATLLRSDDLRDRLGSTNHAAATGLPLADIVEWHLMHIDELVAA